MKPYFSLLLSCLFFLFSCKTPKDTVKNQTINTKDSVWVYDFTVRMALDLMPHEERLYDSLKAPRLLQWSIPANTNLYPDFLFYTAFQNQCAAKRFPDYIDMVKRRNYTRDSIFTAEDSILENAQCVVSFNK
jgi:hypothetical protein